MKIYINQALVDEQDIKVIKLLEENVELEKRVKKIRKKYTLPAKGFDHKTFDLDEEGYALDSHGNRLKLLLPQGHKSTLTEKYSIAFNSNPSIGISKKGEFGNEVESLCKDFNLSKRWYQAVCYIILTSSVDWLHPSIEAYTEEVAYKSDRITSGVVLRINENLSKKQIVKWLDKNWNKYREQLVEHLNMNSRKNIPTDSLLQITKEIIRLKEKEGKTFEQISKELTDKYSDEKHPREYRIAVSEDAIKHRYLRYKELFGL